MLDEKLTKNIGLRGVTVADSAISLVDGQAGRLLYRGFSIQELAQKASYEEIIFLLLAGAPPVDAAISQTREDLGRHRVLPKEIVAGLKSLPLNAGPMDVVQGVVPAFAATDSLCGSDDRQLVYQSCLRLISGFALAAAAWQRIRLGKEPVEPLPDPDISHAASFLHGMWGRIPTKGEAKLMDLLLILHAEHSFNASTFAVREVASTKAHLYAAISAGVGALSGPLHGGANARVMGMLLDIAELDKVETWVTERMAAKGRIMGLGHAVYKTEDPRAAILRQTAEKVLAGKKEEKWFRLCLEVEKVGRAKLKAEKNLEIYPNVDFYSSPVLYGLGFPIDMFPVFFAVSRVAGWCAHYLEERFAEAQPKPALYRPRANYVGRLCGTEGCPWIAHEQ